jgi:chromate transport protein ChrA
MAIIAIACVKLARLTNRRDVRLWAISLLVGAVTAITGAEIAVLFIAAGLVMVALDAPPRLPRLPRRWRRRPLPAAALKLGTGVAGGGTLLALALPAAALKLGTGVAGGGTLLALALFFGKAGAFIFGSGLAIVPFLREGVVDQHHWLTARQFLDAVAMGLITPGPVVITAAFIGYLVKGLAGALVATTAIFTPIYLGVAVRRPPVGVAAPLALERAAARHPQRDHGPLPLGDRPEDHPDQAPVGVLRIVAQVGLAAGGGEDLAAHAPHLAQDRLLHDHVAREPVQPVDHDPFGQATVDVVQGVRQAGPGVSVGGAGQGLVAAPADQPVAVLAAPRPDRFLLHCQAEPVELHAGAHPQVANQPPAGRVVPRAPRPQRRRRRAGRGHRPSLPSGSLRYLALT